LTKSESAGAAESMSARPLLRGWSHELAFMLAVPAGVFLALEAHTGRGRLAAIVYASTVAFMFGASGIYHRVVWRGPWRLRMRRVDHAGIYLLIAGSYTPFCLLVLNGTLQVVVLAVVWAGAAAALVLKVVWVESPKWLAVAIAVPLGWVAVVVLPEIVHSLGVTACLLVLAGGILYTLGALVYAFRRPDPSPLVFGYHEVFHLLVIVAVCLQYSTVAFYVLPSH
jgi:hemolysin III